MDSQAKGGLDAIPAGKQNLSVEHRCIVTDKRCVCAGGYPPVQSAYSANGSCASMMDDGSDLWASRRQDATYVL